MSNHTTNLLSALSNGADLLEYFRIELENTVNMLLQTELTAFLNYEKYEYSGYGSGNSRNGSYTRTLKTQFGPIQVEIPRDRQGEFKPVGIPSHSRTLGDLEQMVIHMYRKGITTREIADLIEKMYGCHYSPQSISNITAAVQEEVDAFHARQVKKQYVCLYLDATYVSVRRGCTSKEALHIILGITPEGEKEVLEFMLCPQESSEVYRMMLQDLKARGLEDVLLVISDGLTGLARVLSEELPKAIRQRCWVHISRNVRMLVKRSHAAKVTDDLKRIYKADSQREAESELVKFLETWAQLYPRVAQILSDVTDFFGFFSLPASIRPTIYSNNLLEAFNKHLKRFLKHKEQFPNEDALNRFVCTYCVDYNARHKEKAHKGFLAASYELSNMF